MTICSQAKYKIDALLTLVETNNNVIIPFAAEAGSRAWGFPSLDSDYDVRFIYVRPYKDYNRVHELKDYIDYMEMPYDLAGWDIKKTCGLLYKSNAALLEWLHSPYVYANYGKFGEELRELAISYTDNSALVKHYANMAKRCYQDHLNGTQINMKKYFYAIRPLLAAQHVSRGQIGLPPVNFEELLDKEWMYIGDDMGSRIWDLYEQKKGTSSEREMTAPDEKLLEWIVNGVVFFQKLKIPSIEEVKSTNELDAFLHRQVEHYGS